ncbi:MAG: Rieske (2Fe-2S) protein [Ignavibacteriae bacterium]|nr:Rieske (2Fe-2S) protein [Ignavibacteriota bacterium]
MKLSKGEMMTRRKWLASALMGGGLLLSYGALAVQGLLYVLPEQVKSKTRKLFAGQLSDFHEGKVKALFDLQGNQILVKRQADDLKAYSTVCPHLGCRVQWVESDKQFFCPCHRGVFREDGVAIGGPPADAGQRLAEVPLEVDRAAGVVYIEVKDIKRRS